MVTHFRDVADKSPWTFYSQLRGRNPIWDDSMNAWLVADHDTCAKVLQQERTFERADEMRPGATAVRGDGRTLAVLHGAEQTKLHRYYVSFMDERRSAEYRTTIVRPTVNRLINDFASECRVDLASQFCDLVPLQVGMQLVGLDVDDKSLMETIKRINADFSQYQQSWGENQADTDAATTAVQDLKSILMPLIRSKRENPGEDHVSRVWQTGSAIFEDWNEDDTFSASWLLLRGGETVFALRNMVFMLLSQNDVQEKLRTDSTLVPAFVEETLRYVGVLHWPVRRATRDVELAGVHIKAGELVIPLLAAAGRDPARYHAPHAFSLEEDRKQHLAFGFGPRYCPGNALARTECIEAIEALISRFDSIRLDPTAEQPHYAAFRLRCFAPLNVEIQC